MTFRFSLCERHGSYDAERHKVCPQCSAAVTAAPPEDPARPSQLETQRPVEGTPTGRVHDGITQRDHGVSTTTHGGRPTTTHGGRPTTTHGRPTTTHGRRPSQLATQRPPPVNSVRTVVANAPSTRVHGLMALGLFALVGVLGYRQCSPAAPDASGAKLSAAVVGEAGAAEVTTPDDISGDEAPRVSRGFDSEGAAQAAPDRAWPAVRYRARPGELADICGVAWLEMYDRLQRAENGAEPGAKGQTMLMLAAESGSLSALSSLLGAGANVDERDALNHTALTYAARRGRTAHAQALLRAGADGRTRGLWDASGGSLSALDAALLEGARDTAQRIEHEVLQGLMRLREADLSSVDEAGDGPLHWVARYADAHAAELLVERGAALELRNCPTRPGDQHGLHRDDLRSATPLLVAIWAGNREVASALLKAKADVGARDERGRGVFHVMRRAESLALAEQLLAAGADPMLPDRDGKTPAELLASRGLRAELSAALTAAGHPIPRAAATLEDLFGVIRRLGGDVAGGPEQDDPGPVLALLEGDSLLVNETDAEGRTALFEAARQGLASVVEALVARGARVDLRDPRGVTALHRARDKRTILALVSAGAAVDARDQAGSTPLHWQAATPGALDAVSALIDAGAKPTLEDAMGRTPLALAQRSGSADVVAYLEQL